MMSRLHWLNVALVATLLFGCEDSSSSDPSGSGGTNNGSGGTSGMSGVNGGNAGATGNGGNSGENGLAGGNSGGEGGMSGGTCPPGSYGSDCTPCDCEHGACDDGYSGSGECQCDSGWDGTLCDECLGGHYGPSCSICTCVHGTCDEGLSGSGDCECEGSWTGDNCQTCAPDHYGPTCSSVCPTCAFGECDSGALGSGDCCITVGAGEHHNVPVTEQTGVFSATWDVTPSDWTDGVCGFSVDSSTTSDWPDLTLTVRFAPNGIVDARNGPNYEAEDTMVYAEDVKYHVRVEVDIPNHIYSAWVKADGSDDEYLIADDYSFRDGHTSITSLANFFTKTQTNVASYKLCNFVLEE